jgi:uncharacterized integral membrane protein
MIRFISLLVSIPLIILIAAFTFKNAQLVSLDLFVFQISLPMAVILLISLLIGFALGYLFNILALINQKKKYIKLKHKKETLKGLSDILKPSDK